MEDFTAFFNENYAERILKMDIDGPVIKIGWGSVHTEDCGYICYHESSDYYVYGSITSGGEEQWVVMQDCDINNYNDVFDTIFDAMNEAEKLAHSW